MEYKPKRPRTVRIKEAAALYRVAPGEEEAMTTISSKNQITLPAHLLRELGLAPGDRLAIKRDGARLVLRPRPKDWVSYYGGSLAGVYGNTREETDHGIEELRAGWDDREGKIEEAWPDPGTPPS
jgi:AbrB family looped-hinge helix DNA binding protein